MKQAVVKLGFPSGSLNEATLELFRKAGFDVTESYRSYAPTIDDVVAFTPETL